jgi:TPR repeat protein
MYEHGWGVSQNYAEAMKWYRKAAEQGEATAQANLGFMYDRGQGVTEDVTQAAMWFSKAAEQGKAAAQTAWASSTRVAWARLWTTFSPLCG